MTSVKAISVPPQEVPAIVKRPIDHVVVRLEHVHDTAP